MMSVTFLKRSIIQRMFGKCATTKPANLDGWQYVNGQVIIDMDRVPELDTPGGSVRLEGKNLPERLLVILAEDRKHYAFQNRCTHMGHRRLDFVPGTQTIQCCSVNKSTYDFEGNKIFGPNPQPIRTYEVIREGRQLIVSID